MKYIRLAEMALADGQLLVVLLPLEKGMDLVLSWRPAREDWGSVRLGGQLRSDTRIGRALRLFVWFRTA